MEATTPEDVFDYHLIVCDVCGEDRYELAHDERCGLILCEEHWNAAGLLAAARTGVYVGSGSEWAPRVTAQPLLSRRLQELKLLPEELLALRLGSST